MMNKNNYKFLYFFSFSIPALIMIISFAGLGIYPGGRVTPLIFDLRMQQLSFYNYINNLSNGFNSFDFQSLGGIGGNVIDAIQMCCGPFSLLFKSVDYSNIPWIIWFLIVFLVGLCGLNECIYLLYGFPKINNSYLLVFLSSCYALCSGTIIFTLVPVWIIGPALLPIIGLAVDYIVEKDQYYLFIFVLSLSIIFNYYMSYIHILFSLVYFVYRLYILNLTIRHALVKTARYFLSGVVCVLLTSFSWLPVIFDLTYGKIIENRLYNYYIIRNPFIVLRSFLPFSYDGLDKHSLPFVYCGFIAFLLFILFFLDKKINARLRRASFFVFIYYFICFCIGIFDISWMFFSEPNGYPSRYSFCLSFFIILFAALKANNFKFRFDDLKLNIFRFVLSFIVIFELFLNTSYLLKSFNEDAGPYSEYAEFIRVFNTMYTINAEYNISDSYSRCVKNWRYTNDDGILFGYSDIDYSSSSYNSSLNSFLENLGFNGQYHLIRSTGITPVVASVLGVKHFIQFNQQLDEYYNFLGAIDGLNVYENEDYLPISFAVDNLDDGFIDYSDNPFENINSFIQDLHDTDPVFEIIDSDKDGIFFTVYCNKGDHIWMYAVPVYSSSSDIQKDDNGSDYFVYLEGTPIAEYANTVSAFCVDLGVAPYDNPVYSLDDSHNVQEIYFANYNIDSEQSVISELKKCSAYNLTYDSKKIDFNINMNNPNPIIITLPFQKGYSIYVDGKINNYRSYNDAFILIDLDEGEHRISITYSAPGKIVGIIISIASIIGIAFLSFFKYRRYLLKNISLFLRNVSRFKMNSVALTSFVLSFLFSSGIYVSLDYNKYAIPLVAIIFVFINIFLYLLLNKLYLHLDKCDCVEDSINLLLVFAISFIILIVLYSISFLALYPGIFAYDAPYQVQMYFSDSISEWQPVIHTLFLGKIIEIMYKLGFEVIDGVAISTIIQIIIISACFSYLLKYIYEKTGSIKKWIISLVYLGAFPTIALQTISATKDSFYMAFFILSMTLTLEIVSDFEESIIQKSHIVFWILSVFIMIIMRNNCIYAFPILAFMMIFSFRKKKIIYYMFFSVCMLLILYKFIFVHHYVAVQADTREMLSVPTQQLATVYLGEGSVLSNEDIVILDNLFNDDLKENFVFSSADAAKASLNMDYLVGNKYLVIKCYLNCFIHNFHSFMSAFVNLTRGFWFPFSTLTLYGQGYKGYWVIASAYPYYISSKIPFLARFYALFSIHDFSKVLFSPIYLLFAPATYFYIFIIMFGYALDRRKKDFIIVFSFTLTYWITFLAGPMVLVRYTTYLYAIVPLYFALTNKD